MIKDISNFNSPYFRSEEPQNKLTKKRNLPLLKFEINDVKKNLQQKNIKIVHKEKRAKKNSNEGINQDERIFNETSSPLNKIKKTDLPPEICPLEINSPVSDLIIILDCNEWKALLKPAPLLTFQKKIEFLKEQLTRVENFIAEDESPTQWWEAWLEISPPCEKSSSDKSLQVILVEDQYDSNTFPENEISEFSDKKNNGEKKQK